MDGARSRPKRRPQRYPVSKGMGLTIQQELYWAALHTFRTVIPLPHDRIPWTSANWPYAFTPFLPAIFLAYLARRRDTYIIRLLLVPFTTLLSAHVSYRYYFTDPRMNSFNWGQACVSAVLIGKALDLGLSRNGRRKIGEMKLPPIGGNVEFNNTPASDDESKKQKGAKSALPPCIYDPLELLFACRGIGWDYGRGVFIPRETRSLERKAFLRSTLMAFVNSYLMLDVLDSLVKLVPGVGSPEGGSIFLPQLPYHQRYLLSTAIHLSTGFALIAGFELVHSLLTLIAVGIFGQSPLSWPPLLDKPWMADSLTVFWGQRWHQMLRRTFVVFGGYPASWIAGPKVGMVFGAFFASGLFHELPIYTMGKGLDHTITLCFMVQAVAVSLEKLWKKATGTYVRGWWGMVWVYFCILILAQPCVNAWHMRGLAGGILIPPSISPTRLFLWPILRNLSIM